MQDICKRNREELIEKHKIVICFGKHKVPQIYSLKPDQWAEPLKNLLYIENVHAIRECKHDYNQEGGFSEVFNSLFTFSQVRKSIRNLK